MKKTLSESRIQIWKALDVNTSWIEGKTIIQIEKGVGNDYIVEFVDKFINKKETQND